MIKERRSMAEIHDIMERLYEKRIGMSDAEVVRDIRESAEAAKKKYGVTLKKQAWGRTAVSR